MSKPALAEARGRSGQWLRFPALFVLMAAGVFLAVGAIFDLVSDARGQLPSDHAATFAALTGTTWQQASSVSGYSTAYITRAEAGYAAFELLFGLLFLIVVAIPLRRGERWAWWSCWLVLGAFSAFGALFGAYDSTNFEAAIVAAGLAGLALFALRVYSQPRA